MADFSADVKAAGGRAIPVKVKGGFHSPFMEKAAEEFGIELAKAKLAKPSIPLYSNMTAQPYGSDAAYLLSRQICSPVRWEETVRNMIGAGIDTFIEIGPGKTLTNMIRKTDPAVTAVSFEEYMEENGSC